MTRPKESSTKALREEILEILPPSIYNDLTVTQLLELIQKAVTEGRIDELVRVSEQFNPKDGKPFFDQDLYIWIWETRAPELDSALKDKL